MLKHIWSLSYLLVCQSFWCEASKEFFLQSQLLLSKSFLVAVCWFMQSILTQMLRSNSLQCTQLFHVKCLLDLWTNLSNQITLQMIAGVCACDNYDKQLQLKDNAGLCPLWKVRLEGQSLDEGSKYYMKGLCSQLH